MQQDAHEEGVQGIKIRTQGEIGMTGKFLRVKCEKCKNEQAIFEKATAEVKCLVCGEGLARPTGGKAEILAKVVRAVQ